MFEFHALRQFLVLVIRSSEVAIYIVFIILGFNSTISLTRITNLINVITFIILIPTIFTAATFTTWSSLTETTTILLQTMRFLTITYQLCCTSFLFSFSSFFLSLWTSILAHLTFTILITNIPRLETRTIWFKAIVFLALTAKFNLLNIFSHFFIFVNYTILTTLS